MTGSRAATHFQCLYQANPDPWGFRTSAYEQTKYRQTLSALGDRHFTSGLEVGCSIGVLTRVLAERCDASAGRGHCRRSTRSGPVALLGSAACAIPTHAGAG